VSELQLPLTAAETAAEFELVDGELVASSSALSPSPPPAASALEERNLFAEAERIAARAATASTRRQYAAIFRAFGDWLAGELGRPPVVGDLDADVIAAYARHLATSGGRGGGPAAPATVLVYLSMVRALARELRCGRGGRGRSRAQARARAAGDAHRHRLRQLPAGARPSDDRGQPGGRAGGRRRRSVPSGAGLSSGICWSDPSHDRECDFRGVVEVVEDRLPRGSKRGVLCERSAGVGVSVIHWEVAA
jgi:hypothetical protein